jgi:hypothetical protein
MEIVSQISQWIQENHGIFTFGTHTPMDESIFDSLSEYLLKQADSYSTKNAVSNVSYLKSFSLKDSVFVFRSLRGRFICWAFVEFCATNNG